MALNQVTFDAGMSFMEVILLKALTRKLHCGSLRALLTGKAASTVGSMSKRYIASVDHELSLVWFDPFLELCYSVVGALVWILSLVMPFLLRHFQSYKSNPKLVLLLHKRRYNWLQLNFALFITLLNKKLAVTKSETSFSILSFDFDTTIGN